MRHDLDSVQQAAIREAVPVTPFPGMPTRQISRRFGLQAAIAVCGQLLFQERSLAGRQTEEPLIDSVRTALSSAIGNAAPPVPEFASTESRLKYLRWLGTMSERLKKKKNTTRQTKHFYPRSPCGERLGAVPDA